MRRVIAGAALLIAPVISKALAEPGGLAGEALRRTIAGRTIVLDTPVGGIPIVYRTNGTLAGNANMVQALGTGPRADSGRWWIIDDRVCQQWNAWLEGRRHCYAMRLEGTVVHWRRDDGRTGTARIMGK
jgi:hypothetical protein